MTAIAPGDSGLSGSVCVGSLSHSGGPQAKGARVQLTRVVTQFDDGLTQRSSATPTCSSCCCCCCCVATTVSAPIINGVIAVNIAERNHRRALSAGILGAAGPVIAVLVGIGALAIPVWVLGGLTSSSDTLSSNADWFSTALGLASLILALGLLYLSISRTALSAGMKSGALRWTLLFVLVYGIAFAVEFVGGAILVLMVGWFYFLMVLAVVGGIAMGAYAWLRSQQKARVTQGAAGTEAGHAIN